jgi:hypothetical protein
VVLPDPVVQNGSITVGDADYLWLSHSQ